MRRVALALGGGALPIAAAILIISLFAGTFAIVTWDSARPQPPGPGIRLGGFPPTAAGTSAIRRTAAAFDRRSSATAAATPRGATIVAALRGSSGSGRRSGATGSPGPAPSSTPRPSTPGGGTGGGTGNGGTTAPGDSTSSPTTGSGSPGGAVTPPAPAATREAPLGGIGTIVAVAAENATEGIGLTVDGATQTLGTATMVGATADAVLTQVGRAVGHIVRETTGAPPRTP